LNLIKYFLPSQALPLLTFMAWHGLAFSLLILFWFFFLIRFLLKAQRSAALYAFSLLGSRKTVQNYSF